MNVIIIEDEARAANHIERLINKVAPEMNIVAKFESIRESVNYLQHNAPQLIFSDVQLADGLSFEIFKQIKVTCPIVFTTAYDQYAIEAFKTNGLDYLLKPIEQDRLEQAINKVKSLTTTPNLQLLLSQAFQQTENTGKQRFMVKITDRIKTIPISDILMFYSFNKGSYLLNTKARCYAIDYTMDEIETLVSSEKYFRVNRKAILSVNACQSIVAWSNSRLKINIDGHDEPIIVAREKVREFKNWLDR